MQRFLTHFPLVLAGLLALPGALHAQPQPRDNPGPQNQQNENGARRQLAFPVWKAELPGGTYIVARNAINAVSTHQYILDGVARVTEVNVNTVGVFQPRFYYLEMLTPQGSDSLPSSPLAAQYAQAGATEAAKQAAPEVWSKVVKNYPATTHAGTIEYRLDSPDQLQKLFESVERVWLTGESEVYTPEGVRPYNPADEIKSADDSSGDGGPGSAGSGAN